MGLFGGGNSSSSTRTTSQSSGFSQVSGDASAIQGSNNNISFVDPGALAAAQSIAGEALNQVDLAQQNSANTASSAIQAVSSAAQGQSQSIILEAVKWGAIVALGFFGLKAFGGK